MFAPYIFARSHSDTSHGLPHDPPHKPFVFSSRPIWILVPLWGLIIALAVVSTPRPAQAEDVQSQTVPQANCAQTMSDSKIFNKNMDDTRAIEERKKCYSSHFERDAKPAPKAVKGERVMQPEYGAGSKDGAHETSHTVQQKAGKPERAATGYLKIGDIKGESKD